MLLNPFNWFFNLLLYFLVPNSYLVLYHFTRSACVSNPLLKFSRLSCICLSTGHLLSILACSSQHRRAHDAAPYCSWFLSFVFGLSHSPKYHPSFDNMLCIENVCNYNLAPKAMLLASREEPEAQTPWTHFNSVSAAGIFWG